MATLNRSLEEELLLVREELRSEKEENGKLFAQLVLARNELSFQKDERGKRIAELGIANIELAFQQEEKGKRAAELGIANIELAFEDGEKEKRAMELGLANIELTFQNAEKEKRAAELGIANKELIFQNNEKEKRAEELSIANKELLAFTYISSHDLQEPLRKIQMFCSVILRSEADNLSETGKYNFQRIQVAAKRMQQLINDLLDFSRISTTALKFERTELDPIIQDVITELKDTIQEKQATIDAAGLGSANIIAFQFRQLLYNLISNALKFSKPGTPSHIQITSRVLEGRRFHITVKDNGIGFESHFKDRIFEVFQKLHNKEVYEGTGIGLAIVKKIVENHNGAITATSESGQGATFDIYLPIR